MILSHLTSFKRYALAYCCLPLLAACGGDAEQFDTTSDSQQALHFAGGHLGEIHQARHARESKAIPYAELDLPLPAGVAGGSDVVFIGSPLEGRVVAFSRRHAVEVGQLPTPPSGFVLPFILKSIGHNRVAVLDAGGLPSPMPFIPSNPTIHEYQYDWHPRHGFSAELTRSISFETALVGFAEDMILLDDGRYLLSDAILGSLWIAEPDGTITPGIVPESFEPAAAIPELTFCETMPLIEVGGLPFLFSGSTLPGISPLAERDGTVYFYSPCAEGLYSVPLASLSDSRLPHERAEDIRLVSPKPDHIAVEQLLGITFNPANPRSPYLYAADSLQLQVIRINVRTGERQVVASDPHLFNFPSSLAFLPTGRHGHHSSLLAVSNQQHRTTLTNDALDEDVLQFPFVAAQIFVHDFKKRRRFAH